MSPRLTLRRLRLTFRALTQRTVENKRERSRDKAETNAISTLDNTMQPSFQELKNKVEAAFSFEISCFHNQLIL